MRPKTTTTVSYVSVWCTFTVYCCLLHAVWHSSPSQLKIVVGIFQVTDQ